MMADRVAHGYDYQSLRDSGMRRLATAEGDLDFLAFFASAAGGWRLGVLKMNPHTAAKGGPTST